MALGLGYDLVIEQCTEYQSRNDLKVGVANNPFLRLAEKASNLHMNLLDAYKLPL